MDQGSNDPTKRLKLRNVAYLEQWLDRIAKLVTSDLMLIEWSTIHGLKPSGLKSHIHEIEVAERLACRFDAVYVMVKPDLTGGDRILLAKKQGFSKITSA